MSSLVDLASDSQKSEQSRAGSRFQRLEKRRLIAASFFYGIACRKLFSSGSEKALKIF